MTAKKTTAKKKTTATAAPAPVDFNAQYGVQAALVNSDPGLKALFNQAVAGKWTAAKFNAEFQNTSWFKTHSDAWRVAETTRLADPASWKEQVGLASENIKATATALGFQLSDADVANLASQSLYMSGGNANAIDTNLLKKHVVETGRITGVGGEAAKTIDALKNYSYNMGVSYNDDWYTNAATNILTGDGTIQNWNNQIKTIAKSKYAGFADQLDAGATVMDIASPYMNSMAKILELNPTDIKLDDPSINQALTNLGQDGKPAATPIWQFENSMRQDPRWQKTQNARDAYANTAHRVLSDMGLVG
jgi:hypothetical protein